MFNSWQKKVTIFCLIGIDVINASFVFCCFPGWRVAYIAFQTADLFVGATSLVVTVLGVKVNSTPVPLGNSLVQSWPLSSAEFPPLSVFWSFPVALPFCHSYPSHFKEALPGSSSHLLQALRGPSTPTHPHPSTCHSCGLRFVLPCLLAVNPIL